MSRGGFRRAGRVVALVGGLLGAAALPGCEAGGDGAGGSRPPPDAPDRTLDLSALVDPDTGSLPELEPLLSPEDTRALRDGFDWSDFETLPERDADGRPNLHYVALYIDAAWQLQYIRDVGLHHSFVPLFPEERARWDGQAGVFTLEGDREGGVFLFAIVPALFLNALEEAHLAGEPTIRAVAFREPPVREARGPDGTLSYEWLRSQDFVYGGDLGDLESASIGDATGRITASLVDTPTRVLRVAVSPLEDTVDEARVFAGEFDRAVAGSAKLTVSVVPLQTDERFQTEEGSGGSTPIVRAWGRRDAFGDPRIPTLGEPIYFRRVRVQSHKGVSLFRGTTGDDGVAVFDVAKGKQNLCVELANDAAEVTSFLTAIVLCNFADENRPDLNLDVQRDEHVQLAVRDYRTNIFAQMQDSYDYMSRVVGRAPRQARAITGFFADVIGEVNGGRALAPCLGNGLDLASAAVDPVLFLLPADIDLVFPFDRGTSANSRGVATHEYGHFVLCDLMHATNAWKYQENWANVTVNILGAPGADNDSAYINEAFADFFTLQVVGGTNYPRLHGAVSGGGVGYCPTSGPDAQDCAEDNVGGPSQDIGGVGTYNYNIARAVSLLHDVFDGSSPLLSTEAYRPNPGAAFPFDATLDRFAAPVFARTGIDDERVALPGRAIPDLVRRLFDHVSTMNEGNLHDALSRLMLQYGYDERAICELFELHAGVAGVPGLPGVPDYESCGDMVSRAALDTTAITPSRPSRIRVDRDPTDPTTATFRWDDLSLTATGYELALTGDDGVDRSTTVPYSRTSNRTEGGLTPDTRYEVQVTTVNGPLRAGTTVPFVTYAAPPLSVEATPERGAVRLDWRVDGAASLYVIWELAPVERELFTTADLTATVRGLSDRVGYRFGVAALNQGGERSALVETEEVEPLESQVLYVSPEGVDDDDPTTGTPGRPFRTLGRALAEAAATGANAVHLAEGRFEEPAPVTVTADVDIRGGFVPGTPEWTSGFGDSTVLFSGSVAAGAPFTTRLYNRDEEETQAGLVVAAGIEATLRSVEVIQTGAVPSSACLAAVAALGTLTIDEATVALEPASVVAGGCVAAVVANDGAVLRIRESLVEGSRFRDTNVILFQAAGVAAAGASLDISDSTIYAASREPTPIQVAARAAAVTAADLDDLRVSRATIQTGEDPAWRFTGGTFAGLDASFEGPVRLDNSVFRSPAGGTESVAVHLEGGVTYQTVTVAHVTAVVGTDWRLTFAAPANHVGVALRLAGRLGELVLVNSVLSYAGGGGAPPVRWTALDLSEMAVRSPEGRPLGRATVRGNVLSVPLRWEAGEVGRPAGGNLTYCDQELRDTTIERDLQMAVVYDCSGMAPIASWDVGDNRALVWAPSLAASDRPSSPHCVGFDGAGRPIAVYPGLTSSPAAVHRAGVDLEDLDRAVSAPADRGGAPRDDADVNGAGAWSAP